MATSGTSPTKQNMAAILRLTADAPGGGGEAWYQRELSRLPDESPSSAAPSAPMESAAAMPVPIPPPAGPSGGAGSTAPPSATALQQLAAPMQREGGAGLQEGGLTPLETGLGARMLPANSRALATLAQRRGGRVY